MEHHANANTAAAATALTQPAMSFSSSGGSGGGGGRGVGDCVVVFTTDIAAAKEAAQQSAVQWPPACVAVEAHAARLRKASAVFEDMLDARATTLFKKTVRPHAPLAIMGPGGQQQRVLVVELTTPGQLKQTEVLMRAMYGEQLSGDAHHLLGVRARFCFRELEFGSTHLD